MILNAYAVLDAFVTLLRLGLGLLVVCIGIRAWRSWRGLAFNPEGWERLEDRLHLLLLLAGILLGLNVVSWPIFYLLLQSYIPQWPGVMCIYGVTRIGTGSIGASRFLTPLVTAVQAMKPVLVFLSGSWFVLHLLNRRTRTAPLTGRVLWILLAVGCLAVVDATAEGAYLLIPKKEVFLSAGCCTGAFVEESRMARFLPSSLFGENENAWLYPAYYFVNAVVVLVLLVCLRKSRRTSGRWLALVAAASLVSGMVNAIFLVETAAPRLLHLPNHHCVYDLVPRAPESLIALTLFVLGFFSLGWACVVGWLGDRPEARPFVPETLSRLLYLGLLGYGGSVVILSVELALA